jgi:hypothetical protein
VSFNPFRADPEIRLRQERLAQSIGIAIRDEILGLLSGSEQDYSANVPAALPNRQADLPLALHSLTGSDGRTSLTITGLA